MTITAPYYDSQTLYAPSFSGPSSITAPFLDTVALFAPTISEVDAPALEVLVNGTPLADTFDRSFEDQIADTGSFSFKMLRGDFAGVDFDDLVTFKLDGTARFLGVVEQIDHVALAQGEEADQTVTVSGRGALALLDQHVVYPSRGVGSLPIEEVRTFSWVSPDFDSTSWPSAKQVNRQRDYAYFDGTFVGSAGPVPHIWPDTTGWWIWANQADVSGFDAPGGACLFRKDFTLDAVKTCRIFVAFDNKGTLYIDGSEVTEFYGFLTGRYVEIELGSGTHTIAARVLNFEHSGYNPGGLICAVYTVGGTGLLDELETHTNTTWKCLPYPEHSPGYTHGEVIRLLLEEAGIDGDWTLDFSDETDTDGEPWGEFREITVGVGRTLLEVLRELADTDIDIAVAPGSQTLRAWRRGGRGNVRSVTLQQTTDPATSDFLSLSHAGKRTRLNQALIRYGDGWTEADDASSITAHGVRGGFLELGAVRGKEKAESVAEQVMDVRADPAYSTTGTIHPRSASTTPYTSFEVADWITAPDETDANASMRVQSIAMSEDDEGVIDWPIQLRDQALELEERHNTWLRRMADGALLGGARVSSRAGTPAPTAADITTLRVAEFSFDNTALAVSVSPRRPAEISANICEVYGELTTAGSTTTTVIVTHNGATIATLTFASGVTVAEVPLDAVPVHANDDKFQVEITAAGTGAEGLDVQIRAI